jgi:hypothetical protein
MYESFVSSAIGSFLAELVTLPLCTIKTVYQNDIKLNIKNTIENIYKNHGLKGFYQAATPAIISQVASTSIKFGFYEKIKIYRKTEKDDIINNSINGMLGGLFGSIITHPIDVWKNYNQRGLSYFNFVKEYSKKNGLKDIHKNILYIGYTGSIGKNIALYSSLFPIYDFYTKLLEDKKYKFISPIATTLTVSLIIQPFDYYKTVKMANNQTIQYTRGLSLMIARSIPHFWITMNITEYMKNKILI